MGQGPPAVRNRAAGLLTGVGSWRNSGAAEVMVEGGCLGELPGGEAVLLRGLAGAPVRQSGVAMAVRGSALGGATEGGG